MAYVIVCIVGGLKYYIQNFRGKEIILNGLVDNAIYYSGEKIAKEEAVKYEHQSGRILQIMEVLPKSE